MESRFNRYTKFKTKDLSLGSGKNGRIIYYLGPKLIKDVWFELFREESETYICFFFYPSEVDKFEKLD